MVQRAGLADYTHTLCRMLCYLDCGSGSGKALIEVSSSWFESYYGVENAQLPMAEWNHLVDTIIHDKIGSTFDE